MSDDAKTRLVALAVLGCVTAGAITACSATALMPARGLLVGMDYLPSTCAGVLAAIGFLIQPYLFARRRRPNR